MAARSARTHTGFGAVLESATIESVAATRRRIVVAITEGIVGGGFAALSDLCGGEIVADMGDVDLAAVIALGVAVTPAVAESRKHRKSWLGIFLLCRAC